MVAIPKRVLELVGLQAGSRLDIELDAEQRIVLTPRKAPRYTLEELVAQCDPAAPLSLEDQAWLDDAPLADEAI